MYRYETHCHCNVASKCAHSSPEDLVLSYRDAGFAGLVLTDHFIHGYTCVDANLPWEKRMDVYYGAYLRAKALGDTLDFDVLFGIEHAYGGGQEILCYGIGREFLMENPDIPQLSIDEFVRRLRQYGGIAIQAHPYRYGGWEVPIRPEILDGIEVYNAGNSPDRNAMALEKAGEGDFILTSGGDIHFAFDSRLGSAGVAFPFRVQTGQAFADALKQNRHRLIMP
ncbi:MAG: hypothetical protein IJ351_02710 [Oscillospiraceae bacterium]|nr:hypothetical protein [Oscillospiraceae bacterium]